MLSRFDLKLQIDVTGPGTDGRDNVIEQRGRAVDFELDL